MDVSSISSLLSAQQAARTEAAQALVLRVGQEMTATILDMVDQHVLLEVAGQRLAATLQTDQRLSPGQVVQLVAVDVQPDQVTLRLVADDMLTGPPGGQALASAGLPDTPDNRVALVALLAEGQPITSEALQTLRQTAASLGATSPDDVHAVAYLLARGLPLTAALLAVVREGQAAGRDLGALEDQLRSQAGQLLTALDEAPDELQAGGPELRSLLSQLTASLADGEPQLNGPGLQAVLEQLTVSLEATLQGLLDQEGQQGSVQAEMPDSNVANADSEAPNTASPSTGAAPTATGAGNQGSQAAVIETSAGPTAPPAEAGSASTQQPDGAETGAGGQQAAAAEPAEAGVLQAELQTLDALPTAVPSSPSMEHANATPADTTAGETAASTPPSSPELGHEAAALRAPAASMPAPSPPATAHELARRLIPALDRALQSGAATGTALAAGTELRHTAERLVQAVQFQQLQTILQPTPAEPYVVFPLPIPRQHGEGELQLFVREEGGSPKIDPNDVRLVIDLRLSQLKRVSVIVHVYRRELYCHIEAESLQAQRLLESAAPELQTNLRQLGYAVDPIHCSMAGLSQRGVTREATLQLSKLGRLNVTA